MNVVPQPLGMPFERTAKTSRGKAGCLEGKQSARYLNTCALLAGKPLMGTLRAQTSLPTTLPVTLGTSHRGYPDVSVWWDGHTLIHELERLDVSRRLHPADPRSCEVTERPEPELTYNRHASPHSQPPNIPGGHMSQDGVSPVDSGSVGSSGPQLPLRVVVDFQRATPPEGLLRSGNTEFTFAGWMELLASIESALADGGQSGAASSTP